MPLGRQAARLVWTSASLRTPRLPRAAHVPCTSNESNDNHIASILPLLLQVPAASASPRRFQQPQWTFDELQHPSTPEMIQCFHQWIS